ncbi:hypothetical protein GCM10007298_30650 [Williamsia phyllosphaerae]|uniref:Short chain dehydrogenase n=2 Tax=Williamsia phyllosphaerae TaxID=885042 RepID=A0ABQ1V2G8_9NOCA|nr:hypothetical protein GCM10007298_30650 [Williamsia phyllosphaerae]
MEYMTSTVILTISTHSDAGTLAQRLLRRGCRVAVLGPDVGVLLDAVRGYGAGRAAVFVGDVDDPAEAARLRARAEAVMGPADVIIPAEISTATHGMASVHRLPVRSAATRPVPAPQHSAVA